MNASQCDLVGSVHQLINSSSTNIENVTVDVSQFTILAAGSVLYLASPGEVCTAAEQGKWREEADHFLHELTHSDHHEPHAESEHLHIEVEGLEAVLQELQHHYEPSKNEVSIDKKN